ncbi:MAG TPA: outer membrane lipoprotein-sorting protein [Vicinamibacterales bacterium]|nr:outer membrane lipoprotein-sorting protein [Vicinamibacterales bacterium]
MEKRLRCSALFTALVIWAVPCLAQTADEIIEKHLAAAGGRAALNKLTSRVSTGAISITTPVGELKGTVEVYNKAPNRIRTLVKIDAVALGGGQIINDQRFDGATGYVIDSFNGNREIAGDQLAAMKNGGFPTPLLTYKDTGVTAALSGRETVGTSDAYVIQFTPKTGPGIRVFIDTKSFMVVKTIITVNVPQLNRPIDQVVEFSDYRDVDGIKIPYTTKSTNPLQTITATLNDVKHNTEIDDSVFSKPTQ